MNKKFFSSLMLLIATLLWGLSYSVQTLSAGSLGSFTIVFFKGFGGLFLIIPIILNKKIITGNAIKGGIIIGLLTFIGCSLQQIGMELSTVSKASFITALYIIFVPLIELLNGKKVKKTFWLAIVIAVVGLYFLCFSSSFVIQIGDILLLGGAICFAFQIIMIDRFSNKCDPIVLTFITQFTICLLSSVVMVTLEKPSFSMLVSAWPSLFYLAFLSGLVAQVIQNIYQKDVGPTLGSLIMSLESVFGALFGWLILNQTLTLMELFGCLLVFISILIAELK